VKRRDRARSRPTRDRKRCPAHSSPAHTRIAPRHARDRRDHPPGQHDGVHPGREIVHDLLDRHDETFAARAAPPSVRRRCAEPARCPAGPPSGHGGSGLGIQRGHRGDLPPVYGQMTLRMDGVTRQVRADVAPEHAERQCDAPLCTQRHAGWSARRSPAAPASLLHRIAKPWSEPTPGLRPRNSTPARTGADHCRR